MKIALSNIDRARFGLITAKVTVDPNDNLDEILHWSLVHRVKFLIARCATEHLHMAQGMENRGFFLTDTLVYYQKQISERNIEGLPYGYSWRIADASDTSEVESLAKRVFTDYMGHYHSDPSINKLDADLVYSSWAASTCDKKIFSGAVFLIAQSHDIVGFLSMEKKDSDLCEIVLNGVHPAHQKKGLYSALLNIATNWACSTNSRFVQISTQLVNIAPQKVWCRHGFEPLRSLYTFHKWF